MEAEVIRRANLSAVLEENKKLRMENNTLKADLGFWKKKEQRKRERAEKVKKEWEGKTECAA